MARPAELHPHGPEGRETFGELAAVDGGGAAERGLARLHAGLEAGAGARDDAVAALRPVDPAHGGAHRVRGRDPPARRTAQRAQRLGAEIRRHRGIEEEMHEPAAGEAEALDLAVVGEDHLARGDPAVRRDKLPARALPREPEDGARLGDAHARGPEALGQRADVTRGLQHHRARREEPRQVVARAGELGHGLRVEPLARLAQRGQMAGIGRVQPVGRGACRAIDLARGVEEGGRDGMLLDRLPREGDGLPVQPDHGRVAAVAGIVVGGDVVRQVDHEARVAPRGPLGDAAGLEHHDPGAGIELQEPPRGREPGKARPHHRHVRGGVALERLRCGLAGQDGGPGRRAAVDRGPPRLEAGHDTASAASSARSIQMVFSWVY